MLNNKLLKIVFFSLMCLSLEAKTYASIDSKPVITDKELDQIKQIDPAFDYSKLSDQDKNAVLETLINQELILRAARQEKLDISKEYIAAIKAAKDDLLIKLWQKKQVDNLQLPSINDAQIRQIYEQNKGMFINQEGKARHILVKTEIEAKDIIKELDKAGKKAKEKFIQLANQKSIDPLAKQQQNGGDLGVFQRTAMVPAFSQAAFALKPDTYTKEPVQTQFGYHVIYLESKTEHKEIPYPEAKKIIEEQLKMQEIQAGIMQKIQALREKAKIDITK